MPTNLALDDRLIQEAQKVGKHKTKKEAVTAALTEYIKSRGRLKILKWIGKVEYNEEYNYKSLRRRKAL